nr:hypothetical protein [Streptomyces sp. TLI_235]
MTNTAVGGNLVKRAAIHGEASATADVRLRCTLQPLVRPAAPPGPQPTESAAPAPARLLCPGRRPVPLTGGSENSIDFSALFAVVLIG